MGLQKRLIGLMLMVFALPTLSAGKGPMVQIRASYPACKTLESYEIAAKAVSENDYEPIRQLFKDRLCIVIPKTAYVEIVETGGEDATQVIYMDRLRYVDRRAITK